MLDEDGYLTITDRKADVIIRGGENISALEVEEVLLGMPAVAEAVVVAAPDARLGEHVAAVLRIRAGAVTCRRKTRSARTSSRRAWPGRSGPRSCTEVDDFPRTASGKVQKFRVRQEIADAAPRGIAAST